MNPVREQYELYPYPQVPWLGKMLPSSTLHAAYETGASLCLGQRATHDRKKILLLGCGTVEPYAFASAQPRAHITAVDLSARSVRRARMKCLMHGHMNVDFHSQDLLDFANTRKGMFDYVHSYGVLHHLENPTKGLQALSDVLAPNGFARIMVYSKASRLKLSLLRDALSMLGVDFKSPRAPSIVKKIISGFPETHPLRLSFYQNQDSKFNSGIVDSVLHARENPFSLEELQAALKQADLKIAAWDFSQNLINLLEDCKAASAAEEKLSYLEKSGAWPAPFTFWVTRSSTHSAKAEVTIQNPLLVSAGSAFWSVLLKRKINTKLESEKDLLAARVLLKVNS